jgi:hypothetical protein
MAWFMPACLQQVYPRQENGVTLNKAIAQRNLVPVFADDLGARDYCPVTSSPQISILITGSAKVDSDTAGSEFAAARGLSRQSSSATAELLRKFGTKVSTI